MPVRRHWMATTSSRAAQMQCVSREVGLVRVEFPYMGYYSPVFSNLLGSSADDVVPPPKPSKRTLDLGTKSRSWFAYRSRILLGRYIEPWKWELMQSSHRVV